MANIFKPPCDEALLRSAAAEAPCPPRAAPWILAATILGSSMAFIDGTAVNVALPALQSDLGATLSDVQWVVESYGLLLAALLLLGGALGDRYGRRRVFALGAALFGAASVWCGLAPDVEQLVFARGVQGAAGALLVPGSLAILSASFAEAERGRAIGTWSGATAITAAAGPVLGGWLIEAVSWRAVFFLNVPVSLAVVAIAYARVPESRGGGERRLDPAGAALATLGLGALVYGLIEWTDSPFGNPMVWIPTAAGAAALVAFVVVESRVRGPMMPLRLFRSTTFSGANLLTLFLYTALSGALFFVPFNLIQVQGYSATAAGAAFLPFILLMFLLSRWAGGLVARHGARGPLVIGPAVAAAGLALFILPGTEGGYWTTFFPPMVVLGLGMAVSVAPLTTVVMSAADLGSAGIASGINNAVSRTAGVLAVAAFGILLARGFDDALHSRLKPLPLSTDAREWLDERPVSLAATETPPGLTADLAAEVERAIDESFVRGFRLVMLAGVALCLAAAFTGAFAMEHRDRAP